jgi:hypothetical protein
MAPSIAPGSLPTGWDGRPRGAGPGGQSCQYARRHENRYGRLPAWVYDIDKPTGRSFGDIEFYRARLAGWRGPILEPAVGTGRFPIPLLEGLRSRASTPPEMLERCRANCRAAVAPPLHEMPFQDFRYDHRFAAIVLPLSTFELITDFDESLAVLRRFHAHLEPAAACSSTSNRSAASSTTPACAAGRPPTATSSPLTDEHTDIDHLAQCAASDMRYEHWRDGHLVDSSGSSSPRAGGACANSSWPCR